jgi:hypothetical protein
MPDIYLLISQAAKSVLSQLFSLRLHQPSESFLLPHWPRPQSVAPWRQSPPGLSVAANRHIPNASRTTRKTPWGAHGCYPPAATCRRPWLSLKRLDQAARIFHAAGMTLGWGCRRSGWLRRRSRSCYTR